MTSLRTALVTGSAGFIGYHVAQTLLDEGWRVIGIDSLSDYYDVALKERRHAMLAGHAGFRPVIERIETPGVLAGLMAEETPQIVIHLAAQAGVRYSIENPRSYLEANLQGTFELLEAARAHPPRHMLLASTSSAYGANTEMPYVETDRADHQMSFYAATKKATEAMAHSYAHLFDLPVTMFRFFTVYGPWGRPDMALFKFTDAILEGRPIDVYNHGEMRRDFTYVDDLVRAIRLLADAVPGPATPGRGRQPEPGRALPRRQHRQRRVREPRRLHRGDRDRDRPDGGAQPDGDAARRRARHLGRHRPSAAPHRLCPCHAHARGRGPLRRLVP